MNSANARLVRMVVCLALSLAVSASAQAASNGKHQEPEGTKCVWHNGDREEWVWMVKDEIAVFHDIHAAPVTSAAAGVADATARAQAVHAAVQTAAPGATVEHETEAVTFYKLPPLQVLTNAASLRKELQGQPGIAFTAPVFYPGVRNPKARMAPTGEIVIHFKAPPTDDELRAFAARYGVQVLHRFEFSPQIYLVDARAAEDCLALANEIRLNGAVKYAYPNWLRMYALEGAAGAGGSDPTP